MSRAVLLNYKQRVTRFVAIVKDYLCRQLKFDWKLLRALSVTMGSIAVKLWELQSANEWLLVWAWASPFSRFYVLIFWRSTNEGEDSQQHSDCWNGKPNRPGNAVLDVDHNSDCQQGAKVDGEVKPIEETFLLFAILRQDLFSVLVPPMKQLTQWFDLARRAS